MDIRLVVSGVAMLLAVPVPGAAQQSRDGASEFPCAAPLAWRVARVDDGFGVDAARATQIIRGATELWEDAVGRSLFVHDPERGFPIRIVYDERQEQAVVRQERERSLERLRIELDEARDSLDVRRAAFESSRNEYEDAMRSHQERTAEHNRTVRYWNSRGGAPPEVRAAEDALLEERRQLEARLETLDGQLDSLRSEERSVSRLVQEYNDEASRLQRDFPVVGVEAGVYREFVQRENGQVTSVSREIRLYRFEDEAMLLLVAAHELGHALGLGHEDAAGAIMNAQHTVASGGATVHETEATRLSALCSR